MKYTNYSLGESRYCYGLFRHMNIITPE